jgi:hypothetical protein
VTEPPNTEALLATVREAVAAGRRDASLLDGRDFDPVKWDEREAAIAAIEARLDRADSVLTKIAAMKYEADPQAPRLAREYLDER